MYLIGSVVEALKQAKLDCICTQPIALAFDVDLAAGGERRLMHPLVAVRAVDHYELAQVRQLAH